MSVLIIGKPLVPVDGVERTAQLRTELGVEAVRPRHPAEQVVAEVLHVAGLTPPPVHCAVVQEGAKVVAVAPRQRRVVVDDSAEHLLPTGRAEYDRLAFVAAKALFAHDLIDQLHETDCARCAVTSHR
jgi:hypothetical protein